MPEKVDGVHQAYETLRQAAERDPGDAIARSNFSVVLCVLGRYAEALDHARAAIGLQPRLVAAYINGAVIAGMSGGYATALPWLETALELEPENVPALLLRADALAKLDRGAEAVGLCERALRLAPQNGEAFEILGAALQAARREEEALAAFGRAQALSSSGTIGVRKAMLLLELGRKDEALTALDGLLGAHPAFAAAWYARGLATDFRLDGAQIEAMEHLLESGPNLSFNDRVQLTFAIGRARLELGDLDAAFARLHEGNRTKRASILYDAGADELHMQRLAETFSRQAIAASGGCGDPSERPLFIVGMPRSGTTLIEQILAAHPMVHAAGELGTFAQLAGTTAQPLTCERFGALGRAYVEAVGALGGGAARVVDKMPLNFFHAGLIHLSLPQARIIHVRRDPLDTALSCYLTLFDNHVGFSYDLAEFGRFYRAYERLMSHWRTVIAPDRFIDIDYEDVVRDVETQARRLIAFCGLPWDDACLAFYRAQRSVRTASMNQVRRPIYATSVGRAASFRRYLSALGAGF